MQVYYRNQHKFKITFLLNLFLSILFLCVNNISYAATITISDNQTVNTTKEYKDSTLDMTNGRFTIVAGGSLKIENCIINIKISPSNPFFATMNKDSLSLKNNTFNVTVEGIAPNANVKSAYNLIQINDGALLMTDNNFSVNTSYTVGLLTTQTIATNGFVITGNTFKNFHGGMYLTSSNNATISNNIFETVSFANIYLSGNLNKITENLFAFPGNLMIGDAIDLVNAESATISENVITSSVGYGILIMGGKNHVIDNNKITDGSTYGIYIKTPTALSIAKDKYLSQLYIKPKKQVIDNDRITITDNYIAQNRYGLAGEAVSNLIVTNNTFIQRFNDSSVRQFWTNNDTLLPLASNMNWYNNYYKEAFTQEVPGDNSKSLQFVEFPAHGGVFIP